MWTLTNKLDFDGFDFYRKLWPESKIVEDFDTIREAWWSPENHLQSLNYVRWVDDVLRVHKFSSIEEFRLDFFLVRSQDMYVDRWLRLASARKVRSLDLNLNAGASAEMYAFPYGLLIDFKSLRRLRTRWVNVSDEGVELILRTCPTLEELSITSSEQLTAVKIIGPSPALRRLEINHCENLTSVEVRDAGIVFFMYQGVVLQRFVLKNVPCLVEMHLGGDMFRSTKDFLPMCGRYLSRLEKLTIDTMMNFFGWKAAKRFYKNVKMSNLKQLVVKFFGVDAYQHEFVSLAYFIRASPLLQSFVLEAYGGREEVVEDDDEKEDGSDDTDKIEAMGSHRYPHLKRVKIVGFRDSPNERELLRHLLDNGASLEEFIIDLRKQDNAWFNYNLLMPNSVTGLLPQGYPTFKAGHVGTLKAVMKYKFKEYTHVNIHIL